MAQPWRTKRRHREVNFETEVEESEATGGAEAEDLDDEEWDPEEKPEEFSKTVRAKKKLFRMGYGRSKPSGGSAKFRSKGRGKGKGKGKGRGKSQKKDSTCRDSETAARRVIGKETLSVPK